MVAKNKGISEGVIKAVNFYAPQHLNDFITSFANRLTAVNRASAESLRSCICPALQETCLSNIKGRISDFKEIVVKAVKDVDRETVKELLQDNKPWLLSDLAFLTEFAQNTNSPVPATFWTTTHSILLEQVRSLMLKGDIDTLRIVLNLITEGRVKYYFSQDIPNWIVTNNLVDKAFEIALRSCAKGDIDTLHVVCQHITDRILDDQYEPVNEACNIAYREGYNGSNMSEVLYLIMGMNSAGNAHRALEVAKMLTDNIYKTERAQAISQFQAASGDFDQACNVLINLHKDPSSPFRISNIASDITMQTPDVQGAIAAANTITDPSMRDLVIQEIQPPVAQCCSMRCTIS
jgi:hypothetical protein